MDSTLIFDSHISNVSGSINYHLHYLRIVRYPSMLKSSVHCLCCHTSYLRLLQLHISPHPWLLHFKSSDTTKLIYQIDKFSCTNITQYLIKLHWLSIKSRYIYKMSLLDHKAINHYTPTTYPFSSSLIPIKLEWSTHQ